MNMNCKIIQDLLPLYHDAVCSEESKKLVEDHLKGCEMCKRLLEEMDKEWVVEKSNIDELKPIEKISKAINKGKRKALIKGIAVTLMVALILVGGYSVLWYTQYRQCYQKFVQGNSAQSICDTDGTIISTRSQWKDSDYQYSVDVPENLRRSGSVFMETLNKGDQNVYIHLGISPEKSGNIMYTVWFHWDDEDGNLGEVFMLDAELNQVFLKHYSDEMIVEKTEKITEYRDEIMQIIDDAKKIWTFLK